ncbi:MAG: muconolactone Delta-isomerase family protein [Actinobacteria bacterium]|nr:muconolactone Delta-isomerase family protein [Actinomycetota bacterium]
MEFFVSFVIDGLDALPEERIKELRKAEKEAGEAAIRDGALLRMWRVPGRRDALGVWSAADADALHDRLSSLPLFPYLDIEVSPLGTHYLERTEAFQSVRGTASRFR